MFAATARLPHVTCLMHVFDVMFPMVPPIVAPHLSRIATKVYGPMEKVLLDSGLCDDCRAGKRWTRIGLCPTCGK